jgi:hypothetical protein
LDKRDTQISFVFPNLFKNSVLDAAGLKNKFGGRIVFWGGGVDTQTVLPFGS